MNEYNFSTRNVKNIALLFSGCMAGLFSPVAFGELSFQPSSDVTLTAFGTIDYSVAYQDKSGGPGNSYAPTNTSWTGVNGGGQAMNKLGLRGEYAKDGYTLGFEFAGTVATNTGTAGNSQPSLGLFNDRFNVFTKTAYGIFTVGEQIDPASLAIIRSDNRGAAQNMDPILGVLSVAQGTLSAPQTDMKPTNAFGYSNKFGSTSVSILYKPYTNQNGGSGLQNTDDAGSQASFGITYDDGTFLATAGYMNHHGIGGGAVSTDIDIENQSVGLGYKVGALSIKGGYLLSKSPLGVSTGATIFTGWNSSPGPLNVASEIQVSHLGVSYDISEKNSITVTYYDAKDRLNSQNTAKWLVLGDNYRIDKNLRLYGNLGMVDAGTGANPLTASTTANNVAKPGTVTTQINTGFTFSF